MIRLTLSSFRRPAPAPSLGVLSRRSTLVRRRKHHRRQDGILGRAGYLPWARIVACRHPEGPVSPVCAPGGICYHPSGKRPLQGILSPYHTFSSIMSPTIASAWVNTCLLYRAFVYLLSTYCLPFFLHILIDNKVYSNIGRQVDSIFMSLHTRAPLTCISFCKIVYFLPCGLIVNKLAVDSDLSTIVYRLSDVLTISGLRFSCFVYLLNVFCLILIFEIGEG